MDSSDTALYLQKIEELVYDNGDIITPTLLSAKWDINVIDARSLIEQYLKDTRKCKKDDLAATYMLIGTDTNGNVCLEIVKENELEEKKKLLKNIISVFINSVQKSKDIELNTLAILEPIGACCMRDKPLLGSIVSKNAVRRNLKTRLVDIKKEIQKDVKNEKKKDVNDVKKDVKDEETVTNNKNNQKNGGLLNFVTKDNGNNNKSIPKPSVPLKGNSKKNLMTKFLTKQPVGKPSINQPETNIEQDVVKEKPGKYFLLDTVEKNHSKDSKQQDSNKKPGEVKKHKLIDTDDSDEEVKIVKKPKVQTPKPKPKKRSAKDKGNQGNKRRRIIKQDSDSDDIFESDNEKMIEDEDVVVSDEEVPPPKPIFPSKRKIKKAVSEFTQDADDDGYFKTVNKIVYESASGEDDDDEKQNNQNEENKDVKSNIPETKPQDNDVKKKNVSPKTIKNGKGKSQKPAQNQKQITSFFNKK